jgi:hypothetical protein
MTKPDTAVRIPLRFLDVTAFFALVAVLMPVSWITATHRRPGPGGRPTAPGVADLARPVSAFCALSALVAWWWRLTRALPAPGAVFALMSVALAGVDLAAGTPWWSACEGPPGVVLGALMFFLARPVDRSGGLL